MEATRVSAAPDQSAPERSEPQRRELRAYAFTINLESTSSAKFLVGQLADLLTSRGHWVNRVQARYDCEVLAAYTRQSGVRP